MNNLTHFDADGNAVMVDVSAKEETLRTATARARVSMQQETLKRILDNKIEKGDVLGVARIAGIQAAKKTPDLIPLCHPLPLSSVKVDFETDEAAGVIEISATCKLTGRTGVEMEALTAASVAALTIYDMCKAIDKGITVSDIRLTHKTGGKSGTYEAS